MPTSLWRALAIAGATLALIVVLADAVDWRQYTNDGTDSGPPAANGYATVLGVGTTPPAGGLQRGDEIAPVGRAWSPRDTISAWPAGTVEHWSVRRGTHRFRTTTVVPPAAPDDVAYAEIINAWRFAMIAVALVVAIRRPDAAEARALATFLIAFGISAYTVPAWLPDAVLRLVAPLRGALLVMALGYATLFACVFPTPATGGVRGAIRRAIDPLTTVLMLVVYVASLVRSDYFGTFGGADPLSRLLTYSPLLLLVTMVIALTAGAVGARGADRQRVLWAAGSVLAGFSGVIVAVVVVFVFKQVPDWLRFAQLTIVIIPIGLAYTILRHRTIDIGFVINRAIVLTTVSFVVIGVFALLERALGKIFIDASHVESRSVEIALALGLGFSLRSLHARIERIVDGLFFRRRRRALAELRSFASDVNFITDPDVAIERTVAVVARCADAANAAIFLIADGVFGRATAVAAGGFPSEIGENDPLLVRMRASRKAEQPRELDSELGADIAFPMFVRGTLVGALVLTPKRTGETYDPEEVALLTDLTQRVGLGLDALQTLALRRELDALLTRTATGGPGAAL
jgi:hypothetical protein